MEDLYQTQYISIGIVDIALQYSARTSRESNNAIVYESASGVGTIRPGGRQVGGFRGGETV